MNEQPQYRSVDKYDRMMGALANLPDVTHTKPSTIQTLSPLIGEAQTFIVQTYRQSEVGDTVFLQYVDADKAVRLVLPPKAVEAICRQRDSLSTTNRRKAASATGKRLAAERKARGEQPAFLTAKKKGKRS